MGPWRKTRSKWPSPCLEFGLDKRIALLRARDVHMYEIKEKSVPYEEVRQPEEARSEMQADGLFD